MHKKHSSFRDFIKSKIEAKRKGTTPEKDDKGSETSRSAHEGKGGLFGKKTSSSKKGKSMMQPGHRSGGARKKYKQKMKKAKKSRPAPKMTPKIYKSHE